ncbi:hypothetical protein Cflav_PD2708 [Pedosphaera parvula Ellin514]|uniref:Uncharacterized protein n=1 Tax=Pedosphaera parvula (strain Ellin514) TaxID=320771 RepID=B9XJM8_PEDPL|nr:hypothetical protein Cflav_PD2708 [Pedosphaera parvula Ellin514]
MPPTVQNRIWKLLGKAHFNTYLKGILIGLHLVFTGGATCFWKRLIAHQILSQSTAFTIPDRLFWTAVIYGTACYRLMDCSHILDASGFPGQKVDPRSEC